MDTQIYRFEIVRELSRDGSNVFYEGHSSDPPLSIWSLP